MADTLLQLFARPPIQGQVKTRLIPQLGSHAALAVYEHCLAHNRQIIKDSGFDWQIWLSAPDRELRFNAEPVFLQQGEHLGERMLHAVRQGLTTHSKVILIGSDCLDMRVEHLHQVDQALQNHALVMIPARDGGYVLIAANGHIEPTLFDDIPWGSDRVMHTTQQRIDAAEITHCLLNPLRDIDRPDDLQHYPELQKYR